MYRFHIVTVGSMKKGPLADLASHYQTLLRPYARVDATATKELRTVDDGAFTVLLTEHGKEYDSPSFAKQLHAWSENETRTIQFVVAGPFGVKKEDAAKFDATLSLAKLTFPHEVATMVLYEQLYRAMTILAGKTYHY